MEDHSQLYGLGQQLFLARYMTRKAVDSLSSLQVDDKL